MMLDERPGEAKAEPRPRASGLRRCIVTRCEAPTDELIRFVAGPDGSLVPDLARRLPGRGVWVSATRACVEKAMAAKAFQRSLKRQLSVPADLARRIEQLLERRVAEAVSIANKAGLLVTGFTKVEAAISAGAAVALVHGSDAAADGRDKLDRRFRAVSAAAGRPEIILDVLPIDELSLAIGRENVVHAALKEGGAGRRLIVEAGRLARYRTGGGTTPGQTGSQLDASFETDNA